MVKANSKLLYVFYVSTKTTKRYLNMSSETTYKTFAKRRGLKPEVVHLKHGAEGFWVGFKQAKKVVVYFHGTFIHGCLVPWA